MKWTLDDQGYFRHAYCVYEADTMTATTLNQKVTPSKQKIKIPMGCWMVDKWTDDRSVVRKETKMIKMEPKGKKSGKIKGHDLLYFSQFTGEGTSRFLLTVQIQISLYTSNAD